MKLLVTCIVNLYSLGIRSNNGGECYGSAPSSEEYGHFGSHSELGPTMAGNVMGPPLAPRRTAAVCAEREEHEIFLCVRTHSMYRHVFM